MFETANTARQNQTAPAQCQVAMNFLINAFDVDAICAGVCVGTGISSPGGDLKAREPLVATNSTQLSKTSVGSSPAAQQIPMLEEIRR
jgi:hypothetical protein